MVTFSDDLEIEDMIVKAQGLNSILSAQFLSLAENPQLFVPANDSWFNLHPTDSLRFKVELSSSL